jgi:hypothetical protein
MNLSITALGAIFGEWLITHILWPPLSPDLNYIVIVICDDTKRWGLCDTQIYYHSCMLFVIMKG